MAHTNTCRIPAPAGLLLFLSAFLFPTACASDLPKGGVPGPGTYLRKTETRLNGFRRSYWIHVPKGYTPSSSYPLVVALHGAFMSGREMEEHSGFSALADREGFIVLYPNGMNLFGTLHHWNAGHCCGRAAGEGVDDVGFVESAIHHAASFVHIDRSRVYVTGFSNGGMLAHRLAAERPRLFSAAAALAGAIGGRASSEDPLWTIPRPDAPVPMLILHSRDDTHVPYDGGKSPKRKGSAREYLSVKEAVDFWVEHNGCGTPPKRTSLKEGLVLMDTWSMGRDGSEVVCITLSGWPHTWPGPFHTRDLEPGHPLKDMDAARMVWEFFRRHQRDSSS